MTYVNDQARNKAVSDLFQIRNHCFLFYDSVQSFFDWFPKRNTKSDAMLGKKETREIVWDFYAEQIIEVSRFSRFYGAFCPWGLESEVTFAHDIPYEPLLEYY